MARARSPSAPLSYAATGGPSSAATPGPELWEPFQSCELLTAAGVLRPCNNPWPPAIAVA